MIYLRICPDNLNRMVIQKKDLMEYIDESPVGERWHIEIIEMTEEEFKALPESDGF